MTVNFMESVKPASFGEYVFCFFFSIMCYLLTKMSILMDRIRCLKFYRRELITNKSVCVSHNEEEKVFRNEDSRDKLICGLEDFSLISDILKVAALKTPSNRCVGTREVISTESLIDPETRKVVERYHFGEYIWKSCKDVDYTVECLARGLMTLDTSNKPGTKVAIFSSNCEEWFICSQAIIRVGWIVVTLYTSLPDSVIRSAIDQTAVEYIVVDGECMGRLLSFWRGFPFLRHVITMSSCNRSKHGFHISFRELQFHPMTKIIGFGRDHLKEGLESEFLDAEPDDTALIIFTSGSTGMPKGVMISHHNVLTQIGSQYYRKDLWKRPIFCAFFQSAHIMEFVMELSVISLKGCLGFSTPLTLLDESPMIMAGSLGDLSALKPTLLVMTPLLLERLSKHVIKKVRMETRYKQLAFQLAVDCKEQFILKHNRKSVLDEYFFKRASAVLGGNVEICLCGGKPLSRELCHFFSVVFCVNVLQGYGATETCCSGTLSLRRLLGVAGTSLSHHSGPVLSTVELKLIPWEEGGYLPTDEPHARGEIAIAGGSVSRGYFNNLEQTHKVFKTDVFGRRWFYTGDIGELTIHGTLNVIDRKNYFVKLNNKVYVSVSAIENQLSKSLVVDFVCVFPNSANDFLVAIISPNRQEVMDIAQKSGTCLEDHFLVSDVEESIIDIMTASVKRTAASVLKDYEQPAVYHFVSEIWGPNNNLTTPSMKLKREEIKKKYSHLLK